MMIRKKKTVQVLLNRFFNPLLLFALEESDCGEDYAGHRHEERCADPEGDDIARCAVLKLSRSRERARANVVGLSCCLIHCRER